MSDASCCCCVAGGCGGPGAIGGRADHQAFLVVSRATAWDRIRRDHVHAETIEAKPKRDFGAPLKPLSEFYEKINALAFDVFDKHFNTDGSKSVASKPMDAFLRLQFWMEACTMRLSLMKWPSTDSLIAVRLST